jgi:hypothetical protein
MTPATVMLIMKLVELGVAYGPGIVSAGIEAFGPKEEITMEDLDALEARLKAPGEYMPRP